MVVGAGAGQQLGHGAVAEADLEHASAGHLRRPHIACEVRVEVEVGAVEALQRVRRGVGEADLAGQVRPAQLVPEAGVRGVDAGLGGHGGQDSRAAGRFI